MKPSLHVLDAEPPSTTLVKVLEETLEMARKGELSSVALAYVYRDGHSGAAWSKVPSFSCLLGATMRLQHDLMRESEN